MVSNSIQSANTSRSLHLKRRAFSRLIFFTINILFLPLIASANQACYQLFDLSSPPVTELRLEKQLDDVFHDVKTPNTGAFGPTSMIWQVSRERSGLFGAGRIALLQIAHPKVAAVIAQVSDFNSDALQRFKNTSQMISEIVFGDKDRQIKMARAIYRIHENVAEKIENNPSLHLLKGIINDPEIMLWIHATYWDTALMTYEMMVKKLSDQERNRFYEDTKTFALMLGIPKNIIPKTFEDFQNYMQQNMQNLDVSVQSQQLAAKLMKNDDLYNQYLPVGLGNSQSIRNIIATITSSLLPTRVSQAFDLPEPYSPRVISGATAVLSRVYNLLSERVRYKPAYRNWTKADQTQERRRCPFAGILY